MAINTKTAGTDLSPVNNNKVFANIYKETGLIKLCGKVNLSGVGEIIHGFTGGEARLIEQGTKKTVDNGTFYNVTILPKKLVVANTFTDEFAADARFLMNLAINDAPKKFAKKIDSLVSGSDTILGMTSLGKLPAKAIKNDTDLDAIIDELDSGEASGIWLSSSMLSFLRSQRDKNGAKYFDITKEEINGIPYAKFRSNERVGFVGDFATQAVFGTVGAVNVKRATEGTIGDENLLEENKQAVLTEIRFGFGANIEGNHFAKFVPGTIGDVEG